MEASENSPDPVAKSNRTVAVVLGAVVLVVLVGLIVFFATRTSPEEKALQAVCESRASIEQHVQDLATLTPTTATLDGIKSDIDAIRSDISTIRENEKKLGVNRQQEIKDATNTFFSEVGAVAKTLLTSTSIDDAKDQVSQSAQELLSSYEQTLAPVDCSGVDVSGS